MNNPPGTAFHADGPGPRGLGAIIIQMFRVYGNNMPRMVAIAAIVTIPLIAAGVAAFGPEFMDAILGSSVEETPQPLPTSLMVSITVYGVLYTLGLLAVTGAIAEASINALAGHPLSVGRAYNAALRRLPSIVGASLLTGLIAGLPLALAMTLAGSLSGSTNILLFIVTLVLGIYLIVRLVFAPFAALLEQRGPAAAVMRSWNLVSRMWLRTFGLLFLITFLLGLFQMAFQLFGMIVPGVEAFFVSLVVVPLTVCANMLIYLDLRVRKEGYSLDHMQTELEALSGPPEPPG
ncbi:MAG: hypothetical protein ACOC9B_04660 [Chloroflexota bacterium]